LAYLIRRAVHGLVLEALRDTRVVVVAGARQVGKSTLALEIVTHDHPATAVNLDDSATRAAAAADPEGFLAGFPGAVLIDEIQRVPELLLAIKDIVDREQLPGRFLLTGSANILTAPRIQEALTGRAEIITLWPFSQAELHGTRHNFIDQLLDGQPPWVKSAPIGRDAFVDVVARGGYAEARSREGARRRRWYANYVRFLVERDLREIADAHKLEYVPRLLRLVAAQAANLFAPTTLAKGLQLNNDTVKSYTKLLETIFVVKRMQAWTPSIGSREIQKEKIYIVDSGLMAYLLGADEDRIGGDDQITGKILENFVAMEIARLRECAEREANQYHYRDRNDEVDIVLETLSGEIAGIEVKAGATVNPSDYRGLAKLRDRRPQRFIAGVVMYTGSSTKPLGDRLWAVPISGLW